MKDVVHRTIRLVMPPGVVTQRHSAYPVDHLVIKLGYQMEIMLLHVFHALAIAPMI
jgi:hypothetical protein